MFESIQEQLESSCEKETLQQVADCVQDDEDMVELLEKLQEAMSDYYYQIGTDDPEFIDPVVSSPLGTRAIDVTFS